MKRYLKYFVFIIALFMIINVNTLALECSKYSISECQSHDGCVITGSSYGNPKCVSKEEYDKEQELKDPEYERQKNATKDEGYGCSFYTFEDICENKLYFSCVWNETKSGGYCNTDNLQYLQCGGAFDIPHQVPGLTSFFINFLKIMTPIILIVLSIITLVKAIVASKEDEIKKATSTLKRRLIAAAMVFFVVYIVQFVIMKVAKTSEAEDISSCLDCFINHNCEDNKYYKTRVDGEYKCYYLEGIKAGQSFTCPENK